MKSALTFTMLSAGIFISTTSYAHAYIDPVTGSFIIQGIAAGFAGAMVAFRSLRQRVFALIGVKAKPTASHSSNDVHDS